MLGTTPIERARVREAERICELGVLGGVATFFQNTSPFFAGRVKQSADTAENARTRLTNNLQRPRRAAREAPVRGGERPTIADCTLLAALDFAAFAQIPVDPAFANVQRWCDHDRSARPSAAA